MNLTDAELLMGAWIIFDFGRRTRCACPKKRQKKLAHSADDLSAPNAVERAAKRAHKEAIYSRASGLPDRGAGADDARWRPR